MFRDALYASAVADCELGARHSNYDIIADEYYDPRHITSRNFDDATRVYLRENSLSVPGHGLALDLGSGRGRLNEYCGVEPMRIVHADISMKMLRLKERESALGRVLANALALPFRAGVFTIVAAFLFDPFNEMGLFGEVARVMNRGGIFIGTIPHYEWGLALRSGVGNSLHEAVFMLKNGGRMVRSSILSAPKQLVDDLTGVGLKVLRNETLTLPNHVKHVSPDIELPAQVMRQSVYHVPVIQLVVATRV